MTTNNQLLSAFLIAYSDSGFTNPHEVVLPDDPKDCREGFTHIGKQYWGFETDRHRAVTLQEENSCFRFNHEAFHWLRIGLEKRSSVSELSVSTKWYTGNQVPAISVVIIDEVTGDEKIVLERVSLNPDSEHRFTVPETIATECLVRCYSEGGISRINFFGTTHANQLPVRKNLLAEARISHVSDEHYGTPADAVAGVRAQSHMVGWESARTGFGEQALFHLAQPARISEIVVDTYLHRLNAPLACCVFGMQCQEGEVDQNMAQVPCWKVVFDCGKEVVPEDFQQYMLSQSYLNEEVSQASEFTITLHEPEQSAWKPLVPFAPLAPDTYHRLKDLPDVGELSHLLYMHFPNGGIHGLKVFGQ